MQVVGETTDQCEAHYSWGVSVDVHVLYPQEKVKMYDL